jgi:hypothetical protein
VVVEVDFMPDLVDIDVVMVVDVVVVVGWSVGGPGALGGICGAVEVDLMPCFDDVVDGIVVVDGLVMVLVRRVVEDHLMPGSVEVDWVVVVDCMVDVVGGVVEVVEVVEGGNELKDEDSREVLVVSIVMVEKVVDGGNELEGEDSVDVPLEVLAVSIVVVDVVDGGNELEDEDSREVLVVSIVMVEKVVDG